VTPPRRWLAMPTRAPICGSIDACGARWAATAAEPAPKPPPIVKSGASVPPEVPLPSAIDHEKSFQTQSQIIAPPTRSPDTMRSMLS